MFKRIRTFIETRDHQRALAAGGIAFLAFLAFRAYLKQEFHQQLERPEATVDTNHNLIILCPDVRCAGGKKQIAYKGCCPKCGTKQVLTAAALEKEQPWKHLQSSQS